MTKRRYSYDRSTDQSPKGSALSDLKDSVLIFIGAGILLLLWLIVIIVQVILSFWYVIVPVILCLIYLWFKTRTNVPPVPIPSIKTVETIEDISTNHGTKKVKTTETYHQDKQSSGLIHALFNRL